MKSKKETSFSQHVPLCAISHAKYKSWVDAARNSGIDKRIGFCEDCTPQYQNKMKQELRCENLEIKFFFEPPHGKNLEKGGFIYGAFSPSSHIDKNGERVLHEETTGK